MFKNVTLEMSLKPFKKTDDRYIRDVCRKMFEQWRPLLKNRETVSVMLWTADGSEILDYAGDLEQEFEWCCYVGTANQEFIGKDDHPDCSLHDKKHYYMDNPPVMTYRILKRIVDILKEEAAKAFPNAVIRVGETFDIGPEFAKSDFKYKRHTEILSGTSFFTFGFVDATALLNADSRRYAAYPDDIPKDTPFGTFFGKQANIFLKDMGFDYLWLSNGLGFSAEPWDITGKVFDGKNFHTEKLEDTRKNVFDFWRLFRKECPDFPLETRGTNNSVGIDYATDGVPLYDIYNAGFDITPPPNSPWAALDDNFGLEIMGHMTRICELPGDQFLFRYYIHDPWWLNSPWYDRYNGSAHDIYLPMAVTRITGDGEVQSAETLNLLTVDNSRGDMPDNCVNEPLPHLLKAEKDIADAIAPLVWVYPMREFTTSHSEDALYEMYYGDKYISEAINNGFPLNCVVSTDNFLKTPLEIYKKSILISPIPQTKEVFDKLRNYEKAGGSVIYYGSVKASEQLESRENFIDFKSAPSAIREKLAHFGYSIKFERKSDEIKPNALTISRVDNSLSLSVYSPNLTTDTLLKFPLGAPILTGTDTEIRDGHAVYRFGICEHKECRVFVKQEGGVITLKEIAPVSANYHRKLKLSGLENATVYIIPEGRGNVILREGLDENNMEIIPLKKVKDDKNGVYFMADNLSGTYTVSLPNIIRT